MCIRDSCITVYGVLCVCVCVWTSLSEIKLIYLSIYLTTWVSQYQKGKTNLDLLEQEIVRNIKFHDFRIAGYGKPLSGPNHKFKRKNVFSKPCGPIGWC